MQKETEKIPFLESQAVILSKNLSTNVVTLRESKEKDIKVKQEIDLLKKSNADLLNRSLIEP